MVYRTVLSVLKLRNSDPFLQKDTGDTVTMTLIKPVMYYAGVRIP